MLIILIAGLEIERRVLTIEDEFILGWIRGSYSAGLAATKHTGEYNSNFLYTVSN